MSAYLALSFILFSCAIGTLAVPSFLEYAVKERHTIPSSWIEVSKAPKEDTIHLQIGLKQRNEDVLENHLLEISDPKHYRYKQHLSLDEIIRLTQPSKETQERVEKWLRDHDVRQYVWNEPARNWISADVTIEKAEELLQTKYSIFLHPETSATIHRTQEWSLPKHLHEHIDVIQPTTSFFRTAPKTPRSNTVDTRKRFDRIHKRNSSDNLSKICKGWAKTPECLRTLYGTIDYKPQEPGKNKIAITNYLNQSSHRGDTAKFLRKYRPDAVSAAEEFDIVIVAGAENHQGPYNHSDPDYNNVNLEGDLDAQVALSVAWPTPLTVYNTGGFEPNGEGEPFLVWLNYMSSQDNIPQVVSTSYGDDEPSVPKSYAQRVCHGLAQLGARGVSVLFSTGDDGVAGNHGTCPGGNSSHTFLLVVPVGGTSLGGIDFEPPSAWDGGGGGFSNYFERPAYQQQGAVDAYIKSLKGKFDGRYNKAGRGYPDVAAHADGFAMVQAGNFIASGGTGTSVSTPLFASVISLVNDALLAKGEPPLGFLNPWIYSGGYKALTDIVDKKTEGACNTGAGWPVVKGWDAVTGFGTPNFGELVKAAFAK